MDYEKTLKEALNSKATPFEVSSWIEEQFPELKESEDERIRKEIVSYLKTRKGYTEAIKDPWIAWLEKQGEQKPAEWTAEDKSILFCTISDLKFLRDTISKDPKYAVNIIDKEREINWLKSLRPQNTWKPSDEQMDALLWCVAHLGGADHRVLGELYEHLKQLRGE